MGSVVNTVVDTVKGGFGGALPSLAFDPSGDSLKKGLSSIFGGAPGADTSSLDEVRNRAMAQQGMNAEDLFKQRENKNAFANQLAQGAMGKGPSLANAQMQVAQDRNLAQQLAMAKSQRGVNPALQARMLQQNAAQSGQQIAGQAGVNRLAEQQQQQGMYNQFLTGQQGYDTNLLSAAQGAAQASVNAQNAAAQNKNAMTGNYLQTGGQLAMLAASDENLKRDIKNVSKPLGDAIAERQRTKRVKPDADVKASDTDGANHPYADQDESISGKPADPKQFLDALTAYSYKYKNPKHGEGEQLSVMAQDLEKAGPAGKAMVVETPEGKVVNYGKGFGAMLAAQTHLNERLKQIEKRYSNKKDA